MGETVLIAFWLMAWMAGLYTAIRIVFWLWRSLVRQTGRAWRGE